MPNLLVANVLHVGAAELRLCTADGVVSQSPLVAMLGGAAPLFGVAALEALARDPRQLAEGYLCDLNTDALGLRGAPHLSSADLLHRHLLEFTAAMSIDAIVLSPALPVASLGLLLGVALRASLRPAMLVDAAALAASLAGQPGEEVLFLEAGIRGTSISLVRPDDDGVARRAVLHVPGLGARSARELWLQHVRERSIALWRIDPLLDPVRAAVLRDGWRGAREALERGDDGSLEFDGGHRLEWRAAAVLQRLQDAARTLVDALLAQSQADGVLLLDAGMAAVPGLATHVARYRETRTLDAGAQARALVRLAPLLDLAAGTTNAGSTGTPGADAEGVVHLLRLPRSPAATDWQHTPRPPVAVLQLLLVRGASGQLLQTGARLRLVGRGDDAEFVADEGAGGAPSSEGELTLQVHEDHVVLASSPALALRVNGHAVAARTVLRPGDALRTLDGTSAQLVALGQRSAQDPTRAGDSVRHRHGV